MSGKIIFFTAPSGAGKTTLVKHLLATDKRLSFSISATTRSRRGDEVDGEDYYFLTQEEFEGQLRDGGFVEHEEVYEGLYYGTLKSEISRIWSKGKHVVLDIDVKGGLSIKKHYPEQSMGVFVQPKDLETLESRLEGRGTEDPEAVKRRLDRATYELSFSDKFDQILVNDDLAVAKKEAQQLVDDFLS